MVEPEKDKLEEQAARIRHAEEEAGLIPSSPDPEKVSYRATARGYRIGTDFVVTILSFVAVGWFIDRTFATAPWVLLLCLIIGFGAGLWNLVRAVRPSGDDDDGKGL